MKKRFFKYFLSFAILLFSICNPLLANFNTSNTSLYPLNQKNILGGSANHYVSDQNQNTNINSVLGSVDKSLEIEAAEIEEEEESTFSKIEGSKYYSASFYLLSLLFLFSYLENSQNLQKLFSFTHLANSRFVLFQVFRL